MFVTTCLMFLVIVTVWKKTALAGILFVAVFGSLELLYFSACLVKVPKGGWLPLLLSFIFMTVMSIWHYGTRQKQVFELQNKVCLERLLSLGPNLGIVRVPGIGLIYSNVVSGVPPMFAHFVTNFPAFHRILIDLCHSTVSNCTKGPSQRAIPCWSDWSTRVPPLPLCHQVWVQGCTFGLLRF